MPVWLIAVVHMVARIMLATVLPRLEHALLPHVELGPSGARIVAVAIPMIVQAAAHPCGPPPVS